MVRGKGSLPFQPQKEIFFFEMLFSLCSLTISGKKINLTCGYSTTVSAPACHAGDGSSILLICSKYATPSYVTVLAEIVQGKGRTLFVRLGVIRTDGRGGNVAPKVVTWLW